MTSLPEKIATRQARVVVMGAGYVGLPLSLELARAGFRTTALDKDREKVRRVNAGESYVADVPTEDVRALVSERRLDATTDAAALGEADVVIICVPTPLNKTRDPDMRFILAAVEEIARHQREDQLVILESTTYPGTTSEVLVPQLTRHGARLGETLFVAFSPERVDPGNATYRTRNTPKVLGGSTPQCLEIATQLYSLIIETIVPVSSTATAEVVKLLENTFRAVNIGLVNELAIMSRRLGVDPFEVIRAAATKPFGFMPFYPGPGLGGHCIPVDPLYLSWKLKTLHYQARFIELADSINGSMPAYVIERTSEALNEHGKPLRGSKILIYGVAYKRNVPDVRESPALAIIIGLEKRGATVSYHDPHVPVLDTDGVKKESVGLRPNFAEYDVVVVVTDHNALDGPRLLREGRLIVDTRDALQGVVGDRSKIHGL